MPKIKENYKNRCIILKYHYFLGKKWTYPFLFHMKENKFYSFEELIYITNREISRSVLLDFLKKAIHLLIIEKKEDGYKITKLGIELKKIFSETKNTLEKFHPNLCDDCKSISLINKSRLS